MRTRDTRARRSWRELSDDEKRQRLALWRLRQQEQVAREARRLGATVPV